MLYVNKNEYYFCLIINDVYKIILKKDLMQ
jgi:hypothetical protein